MNDTRPTTTVPSHAKQLQMVERPTALPEPHHFKLAEVALAPLGDGEVLVKNLVMSVDPYMRGRMRADAVYAEPFQLGEAMTGGAVGEVVQSHHPDYQPGDRVLSMFGWRDWFTTTVTAGELQKLPELASVKPSLFLGTLGMPGLTAYYGLLQIGQPEAGETVFVSAASGAVGANVCQIAKLKGCRVVASVGSDAKAQWLKEQCGVDAVINYKTCGNLTRALLAAAPEGIDVYFENVGGDHLEAAINAMNPHGRIAACGMIAGYNETNPLPGPNNMMLVVGKKIRMQGFIISDHFDQQPAFFAEMGPWVAAGKINSQETVFNGLEQAVAAFLSLFSGDNFGKVVVDLN